VSVSGFRLVSDFKPRGDQGRAIEALVQGLEAGFDFQTLLGVTGSGKTFTIANVISRFNRPVLVISHNKTLAAQLYGEFRRFFPYNAVEYFVSYYDYYQPEAYIPKSDTFIEKDASRDEELERLRLSATRSLFERRDVIVVSSVSCIYGLGSPEEWKSMSLLLRVGDVPGGGDGVPGLGCVLRRLVEMQYERNDVDFVEGRFRVRGDTLEVFPSYSRDVVRVEFFGDEIERISRVDPLTGRLLEEREAVVIYPAKHYVIPRDRVEAAVESIENELTERLSELRGEGKLLEAQRLEQRTRFDLEMLREMGYCSGIENYSRHLDGRLPGEPPFTLMDYFPRDFLVVIDESHVTVPQLRGMYRGDRSRKETLVEYGFRLPSALDNRPLVFSEFEARLNKTIFVSATPGDFELSRSQQVVEQIIRPTGLVDPEVVVRPTRGQIDDLLGEIRVQAAAGFRVLVTTLTKRMAEDLTEYLLDSGVRARYMHSEIDTLERMEIIRGLRLGEFDVLVGINLLREGLDLPEVSLVAILDADKEGYLRSERSLIQTIGRASRNSQGRVIMYADRTTKSMERAISETNRRRRLQIEYNRKHKITPQTIRKPIEKKQASPAEPEGPVAPSFPLTENTTASKERDASMDDVRTLIEELKVQMHRAAEKLDFEKAAVLRDRIRELEGK